MAYLIIFLKFSLPNEKEYLVQTNGTSNGLIPMLRVYNTTAHYVDQGGNKVNISFACYLLLLSLLGQNK